MRDKSSAQRPVLSALKLRSCSLSPLQRRAASLHIHLPKTSLHLREIHQRTFRTRVHHGVEIVCRSHVFDDSSTHNRSATVQPIVRIFQVLCLLKSLSPLLLAYLGRLCGTNKVCNAYGETTYLQISVGKPLHVLHELNARVCPKVVVDNVNERPVGLADIFFCKRALEKLTLHNLDTIALVVHIRQRCRNNLPARQTTWTLRHLHGLVSLQCCIAKKVHAKK